jgi:hypothetical protein
MSEPSIPLSESEPLDGAPVPRSYLGIGLVATILCFLPLGLVTLYFGLQVQRALAEGDRQRAVHESHVARGWLAATIVIGLLVYAFIAVALVLLGAFSS